MGIVEDNNENPIQLEITPKQKPKRVYTEEQKKALCERLALAREMKKKKREEAKSEAPINNSDPEPIDKPLAKKIDKVKRIQKTIVSQPVKQPRRSLPNETKVSMDAQRRNQEIEAAKKLEFESKVAQQVAIEIRKLKQQEALLKKKEEEEEKRVQQKENNEPEEEEYEAEPEEEYEAEPEEEYEDEPEEEYEPTPPASPTPPPPPVMKRQKEVQFKKSVPTVQPSIVSKPVPSRVKQQVYENPLSNIYQRKNPRREYNDPFLNKLFNQ